MDWWNLAFTLAGVAAGWLLFRRLPILPSVANHTQHQTISVIIPARNEEQTLPLLLQDLARQTLQPFEIICVNDESTDQTRQVARSFNVKLLNIARKPPGWVGKSYACHCGAKRAKGSLLLFLDADVRLSPNALQRLAAVQSKLGCTISVQPYHTTHRWYEQLSLFFNLIAAASLASHLPFGKSTHGLFGPVIFIPAAHYQKSGGHRSVKGSILDDMSLGEKLSENALPYHCFVGDSSISFRMYGGGLKPLYEGWCKNFAQGASKSSVAFLVLVILWVAALTRTAIQLTAKAAFLGTHLFILYAALYLVLVLLLFWQAGKVGHFKPFAILLYPLCLLFFIFVFLVSCVKKVFRRPVRWKGRNIPMED